MFFFEQMLAKVQTSLPVRVVAVTSNGDVSPTGFVDVVPMVTQTDALGVAVPHTTIFNLPYCRVQGGANAVIIDPQVGDIGVAVFASRDISKVKYTGKENPPGSDRRYSFSDGIYLFGIITTAPTQYIQFVDGGMVLHTPGTLAIQAAGGVDITSPTLTHNGVNIGSTHVHGGVTTGGSNTGGPA